MFQEVEPFSKYPSKSPNHPGKKTMEQLISHQINRPLFVNHTISVIKLVANTSGKVHLIHQSTSVSLCINGSFMVLYFFCFGGYCICLYIQYSPISHHIISHHNISCNWDLLYISGATIYIYKY